MYNKYLFILIIKIYVILQFSQIRKCKKFIVIKSFQGDLQGEILKSGLNQTIYKFQSIPYGMPPINNLRFKESKPFLNWTGTLKATRKSPKCAQYIHYENLEGSEDCLYLNVVTPQDPNNIKKYLPILVVIHGGLLEVGSGTLGFFKPDFFVSQQIIFVTINYRISIFGFLNIDGYIPGNNGLKDIVLALNWIQNNIKSFGGDPNLVTLFGNSMGGVITSLFLLSPSVKGLFHRLIYQSGSAYCPVITENSDYHKLLAIKLKCNFGNDSQIFNCIKKSSTQQLLKADYEIIMSHKNSGYNYIHPLSIVIESNFSKNPFLIEPLHEIIQKRALNDVPILSGYVTNEALFFLKKYPYFMISTNFTDSRALVPPNLHLKKEFSSFEIGEKIKKFYYGDSTPSQNNSNPLASLISDEIFTYGTINFTRHVNSKIKSPIYFFNFNYDSSNNEFVGHTEELKYLFGNATEVFQSKIGYEMMNFWSNFVKTGNPNNNNINNITHWNPIKKTGKMNYLKIDKTTQMLQDPEKFNVKFWDEIYQNYTAF